MLTDKAILAAKPKERAYRLYDRDGLYLEVSPAGGKLWRFKYRFDGKEKRLSLGKYPAVRLADARERTQDARRQLAAGTDPGNAKKLGKLSRGRRGELFQDVALEWWKKFMEPNGPGYPQEVWRRLEREVFPFIGSAEVSALGAPEILAILRRIEGRGTIVTAHKVRGNISEILKYAIASGLILSNPARDLGGAIAPIRSKPMAAIIDPRGAGRLMRAIEGYNGWAVIRLALKFSALTFVRPGEIRTAEWPEVDLHAAQWRIPADKMKMKRPHLVPLSCQAVTVLEELRPFSGHGRYLFPSIRTLERPISDMSVNAALRAMGYGGDTMTAHGFRAMANSLLSERGWSMEVIDRQLAHAERNKVRAAYHRAEYLEDRRKMMQDWADYLDALRDSS